VAHRLADVVPEIVAVDVATARRIAAFVQGAAVVGLGADVMDYVVLKDVLVADDADGLVRDVVDQIVGGAVATPSSWMAWE